MKKLPYVREVNFLSPTSFMEAERDPVMFYLKRLGPEEFKPQRQPQTGPMAVGSVFDAHVKTMLAHYIGMKVPEDLVNRQVEEYNRDVHGTVMKEGLRLFKLYHNSPAWRHLIEDGLDEVEVPIETKKVGTHLMAGKEFGGVPIYGKPDAKMRWHDREMILDWKVNGSLSESKTSPKPGYLRLWDRGMDVGPHTRNMAYLDDLDQYWATQCAMYFWMLVEDHEIDQPAYSAIEQVVVNGDDVKFAQFRTSVSPNFQKQLLSRLQTIWDKIQNETLLEGTQFENVDLEMLPFLI